MDRVLRLAALGALAVVAGISFVVQAGVNARLRVALGSPNWAALASYAGGTLVMALVVLALREPAPALAAVARAPWWAWLGGLFGAVYVVVIILLLPRLGAAALLALFVLGQMLASLAFDQLGAFGVPKHPVDATRVAGVLMLVAGVALLRR
ncbi:MAG TPA: DMT family transporter [Candidatus Elarobacter sp.]|jgi:transporter family-2 protein|nr:DMT family transporter [Candidatus Elarobacter sp.]